MAILLRDKVYFLGAGLAITDCNQTEGNNWRMIMELLNNNPQIEFAIQNELKDAWIQVDVKDSRGLFCSINIGEHWIGVCYYMAEENETADIDYQTFEEFEKDFNQYVYTGILDWD